MPLCLMIAARTFFSWIPWIAPIIGFMLFGYECYIILAAIFNYVVNNYGHYSASALGGVVFVRNIASVALCRWTALMSDQPFMQVSAIFPLFSNDMFKDDRSQTDQLLLSLDSNTLNIRIVNSNHEEVFFKIKRKTKLNKLKIAYADRVGTDVNAIRLLFDGARILEDQTADDLELEDGDALEVQLERESFRRTSNHKTDDQCSQLQRLVVARCDVRRWKEDGAGKTWKVYR
nr:hypothetical protein L203_00435 [Cryptococcus depauperatus CBS 7841]